jgi:hypothetical protein
MPGIEGEINITVGVPYVLIHCLSNFALVHILDRLCPHRLTVDVALLVQYFLKRIVLPSEYVIAMVPIARAGYGQPSKTCHFEHTHVSLNDHTKGWLPSSGHCSLVLNSFVSKITS